MKNEMRLYLVWVLVVANLLYLEYWGLNVLIAAVATVGLLWYRKFIVTPALEVTTGLFDSWNWYVGAGLWLISATAVFLIGGWFQIFMYLVSMIYFGTLQDRKNVSVPISGIQSIQSFATGLVRIFLDSSARFKGDQANGSRKLVRQILLFSVGIIICIAFLRLYQLADDDFYEMTRFINLEWISWGFILFYITLAWFLYGFYYFKSEPEITKLDESFKNEIAPTYTDWIERFFGVKQERAMALITLAVLNTMLILLLILDIRFMLTEYGIDRPVANYSVSVHQGVNALIFSLVLIMLLISFFFRGSLNFESGRALKIAGIAWLALNCCLTITTGLKNYDYIAEFGFTYKRLGVLLYLFLCGAGLLLCIYKVMRQRSVWFLIRNTSLTFLLVFAIVALFNWNRIIADYNLTHVKDTRLDLAYLYELGPDAYPALMDYHLKKDLKDTPLFHSLVDGILESKYFMERGRASTSWRSLVMRDQWLLKKLNSYQFSSASSESLTYTASN